MLTYEQIKRDPALLDLAIREHIARMRPAKPAPAFASPIGEMPADTSGSHLEAMQRGSAMLGEAIDKMLKGFSPSTPDKLLWRNASGPESSNGSDTSVRPYEAPLAFLPADRTPCAACGVRFDRHSEGGCKSYRRGRV